MDKIMSTRMDEGIIQRIGILATKLGKSKKAVLEEAVLLYAEKIESEQNIDIFSHTFGAWQREEPADETVRHVKEMMRKSQERYKR